MYFNGKKIYLENKYFEASCKTFNYVCRLILSTIPFKFDELFAHVAGSCF